MMKLLLIPYHLQGHLLPSLMVKTLMHLSKRPLSQESKDLISIRNMVVEDFLVVSSGIIIAVVGLLHNGSFDLFYAFLTDEVDFLVVKDLSFLIIRQDFQGQILSQRLGRSHPLALCLHLLRRLGSRRTWPLLLQLLALINDHHLWLSLGVCAKLWNANDVR